MSWQDVAREFKADEMLCCNEPTQRMAEEIVRLRAGQSEFANWQDARVNERIELKAALARSEAKRAKLRFVLQTIVDVGATYGDAADRTIRMAKDALEHDINDA